MKRITVNHFRKQKAAGEKIVMMTAYDAPTAAMAHAAGVDLLLVGDSLATVLLGYRNTLGLTLDESLSHARAVRRGAPEAFIIGDMPFMSFQGNPDEALTNAARYLREAECDAVKLEGGEEMMPLISRMTGCGIPVMGHIGLLPQRVMTAGGYKVAGRTDDAAATLIRDARMLEEAGAFAVVLECMPAELGRRVSEAISIPTIGIGAGPGCDGQVQVVTDVLGIGDFLPKHSRQYAQLGALMRQAFADYVREVKEGVFPGEENSF